MSKKKSKLTPAQSQEEMDQLLSMQLEATDLKAKLDKVAEAHKEAKQKHDLKAAEILQHLEELNRELPLFDKPDETPWPFPVPAECHEATLGNIATDPAVEGLTVPIVKFVREAYGHTTLGGLEKVLGAGEKMSNDDQTKAKLKMGEKLGANSTVRLLRAIASFTGSRKAKSTPKTKKADPVPVKEETPPEKEPEKNIAWRSTRLADLFPDLEPITKLMAKSDVKTAGDLINRIDDYNEKAKEAESKPNPKLALVQEFGMSQAIAARIIKTVFDFEEKNTIKK